MSENQERDENTLEDCSFQLNVVGGVTSLKVEGTLGGISEAFANAALQSPQLDEVLKMVTYMLFEHHQARPILSRVLVLYHFSRSLKQLSDVARKMAYEVDPRQSTSQSGTKK